MEQLISQVADLFRAMKPEDTIIFSHADHDGFSASALLNSYFKVFHRETARILYPDMEHSYVDGLKKVLDSRPKNLIILDSLISKHKWILGEIAKNTLIVNLDHHDNVDLSSPNFINANPHLWGKEYLNSSGLVWLILRKIDQQFFDRRAWSVAAGALQDYCLEDNQELFKTVMNSGMIKSIDFEYLLGSDLMAIAKTINVNCKSGRTEHVYERLLDSIISNNSKILLNDYRLLQGYENYLSHFESVYQDYLDNKINIYSSHLIGYDMRGTDLMFFSGICEKERSKNVYMGYSNGVVTFRSLFFDYDVRILAKIFGGGGPHPEAAGARTTDSFNQVVEKLSKSIRSKKEQASIKNFL